MRALASEKKSKRSERENKNREEKNHFMTRNQTDMCNWPFIHNNLPIIQHNPDPRTNNWPLISSPVPGLTILAAYLYFVISWGPRYMANRKPYKFERTLIVYNFIQVIVSCYIFYEVISPSNRIDDLFFFLLQFRILFSYCFLWNVFGRFLSSKQFLTLPFYAQHLFSRVKKFKVNCSFVFWYALLLGCIRWMVCSLQLEMSASEHVKHTRWYPGMYDFQF